MVVPVMDALGAVRVMVLGSSVRFIVLLLFRRR